MRYTCPKCGHREEVSPKQLAAIIARDKEGFMRELNLVTKDEKPQVSVEPRGRSVVFRRLLAEA